jgi:phosphoglycolate phosphatase-like HAD superfamily hydrolase
MTFEQPPYAALDAIIRQALHLLISFDGPIRSAATGNPAPHISDVFTACRESGRSAAIVTSTPLAEVRAYLDAHDLPPYSTVIARPSARPPAPWKPLRPTAWPSPVP